MTKYSVIQQIYSGTEVVDTMIVTGATLWHAGRIRDAMEEKFGEHYNYYLKEEGE